MRASSAPEPRAKARGSVGGPGRRIYQIRHDTLSPTDTRILYVITDLEVGGVPLHLNRLARAMGSRGFRPTVVSLAPAGPVGGLLREKGIDVRSCNGCCGWDVRVLGRLAKIIDDTRPRIVHSLLFHANVAVRLAALEVGFPAERIVAEIQTVEVEQPWHLVVERWTHRLCRFIIGNSPSVVDHLATRAGIRREALRLIPGGIDPRPLREATPVDRSSIGLGVDTPMVLWVGRLDPVKGLRTLVEAFADVAARTDAHLVLVGGGLWHDRLVEAIARRSLAGRVHLLGSRSDVPALLKSADVFVFPSQTEGLPNALLEAMAAGCPIVTTDVPGCRDLIEHEETGLLVPYGDTSALGGAITRLLGDRDTARRLAQNARASVARRWPIDRMYDAYAALYRAVTTA